MRCCNRYLALTPPDGFRAALRQPSQTDREETHKQRESANRPAPPVLPIPRPGLTADSHNRVMAGNERFHYFKRLLTLLHYLLSGSEALFEDESTSPGGHWSGTLG